MESIRDLPSGRTCQELSQATKDRISGQCYKRSAKSPQTKFLFLNLRKENGSQQDASWETDTALLGEPTTLSIGESPSAARESTLSQILEANVPEKYFLSAKACAGILRRAERRGKELPKMLKDALEEVVASNV